MRTAIGASAHYAGEAMAFLLSLFLFSSCGKEMIDSEGLPVVETAETHGPEVQPAPPVALAPNELPPGALGADASKDEVIQAGPAADRSGLPAFDSRWGLSRSVYDKAADYLGRAPAAFRNDRYAVLIDMSQHSSQKRLFLFNLESGTIERFHVSHGVGSDPGNTGYATRFSNVNNSRMSSLGVYRTMGTYVGKHGLSMRLEGLENTNSNALKRAIVMHSASYVNEVANTVGRSWGCPAVSPKHYKRLISVLQGGAMLVIWK